MKKKNYIKPELKPSRRIAKSTMICQSGTSTLRVKGNEGTDSEGQGQENVWNAWEAD